VTGRHFEPTKASMKLAAKAAKLRQTPGFKVIVAGSRHLDTDRACEILREHWKQALGLFRARVDRIVSGACPTGVDPAGERLAVELTGRKAALFPADWNGLGKAAGPSRNIDMMSCADGLFLIWDGSSRGSSHMLHLMETRKRPVFEIEVG
jgi:hypothetical protein